jgi:hypothetical protein
VIISRHQSSSAVISCQDAATRLQRSSVVISGHQWSSVVISRHQSSSVVISCQDATTRLQRRQLDALIRGHQSSSVVISRHQSSSVVVSGHQPHLPMQQLDALMLRLGVL